MLHPLLVPCLEAPAPAEIPATIKLVEGRNTSALEESWISRDTTFVNSFLNGLLVITGLSVGI